MKKRIVWLLLLLLAILIIPYPGKLKDGGTVHYNAILYDVYDVHRIAPVDPTGSVAAIENDYIEGLIIQIFGVEVFNNTDPHIDN